jgi:hypothetical protein
MSAPTTPATGAAGVSSSSVQALRDSFGDRHIDISRKITACVACRKQKIKCHMGDGTPPCTRCRKRGLSCTVNRSLQMLLESDVTWKESIEEKLLTLERQVNILNRQSGIASSSRTHSEASSTRNATDVSNQNAVMGSSNAPPDQGWEVVMDDRGPGVVPASVMSEVADKSPAAFRQNINEDHDIINQGIITLRDAEVFWNLYSGRLDHFLYRICADHDSLTSVRQSSALLTAAICTVGALHVPSNLYAVCRKHFIELSSMKMFSKTNKNDDVRAFLIGAFWLNDIAWTFVGAGETLKQLRRPAIC